MKHLEKSFKGKNSFWLYLAMTLIIFVGVSSFGSLPLVLVAALKAIQAGDLASIQDVMMHPESYGISRNVNLVLMLLSYVACFWGFALLVKPLHKRTMRETINGRNYIRWQRIKMGILVWTGLSVISFAIGYLTSPENYVWQFDVKKFVPLLLIVLFILPMQTSFEEVFFRGYLAQGVARLTKSRWAVLIILSVAFGAMHLANPEISEYGVLLSLPQYIIMGGLLGLVTILDDGLELALGIHFANNAFACLFYTFDASVLQTDALFNVTEINPASELITGTITSVLAVLILHKIYKWDFSILNKKIEPEAPEQSDGYKTLAD